MSVSKEPLSVRNNNPGNLRYVGQEGATPGEGGFARFETPEAGMEAMRRQIELDTQKRGMNLTQFINKYAPPSENKTQGYIDFVVQKTGLDPTKPVPAEMIPAIQTAMIQMEGGPGAAQKFASTTAPAPAQATPTATRPTEYVQVAQGPRTTTPASPKLTDLPPSYRAALAANYIADTEDPEVSIADKAMAMLEEMQGGGGPRGAATFNKMMGQEEAANPFALMAKAQEPEVQPRRRPVPRMPQRFSNGGAVSNEVPRVDAQGKVIRDAPVPERPLSVGEQAVGMGEAALSLASGLTAPASIAYDVMRGVPRQEVSPSRFMYTPRTEGGQRAAEGLGRFMQEYKLDVATPQVQLQRPYPVRAAAKQGIEALRTTGEALELPFLTETPPAGILRLPGGTAMSSSGTGMDQFLKRGAMTAEEAAGPDLEKAAAAKDMFEKKARDFFEKRAGSIDDELKKELMAGRIKMPKEYMDEIFPSYRLKMAREGDINAIRDIERAYDEMLRLRFVSVIDDMPTLKKYDLQNQLAQDAKQGMLAHYKQYPELIPDDLLYKMTNKDPTDVRIRLKDNPEYFTTVIEPKLSKLIKPNIETVTREDIARYPSIYGRYAEENLSKNEKEALKRSQPLLEMSSAYTELFGFDIEDLANQVGKMNAKELKDITFATFVSRASKLAQQQKSVELKAKELAESLKKNKPVDPKALAFGTESFLELPDGFTWRKIVDPDATMIQSAVMDNSIKGYANYGAYGPFNNGRRALDEGKVELFALYNKDGVPVTNIEMVKGEKSGKFSMRQAQGNGPFTSNVVPEDYMPQLKAFVNKTQPEDLPYNVSRELRYVDAPENFAKGGIVDKPLYDRAA